MASFLLLGNLLFRGTAAGVSEHICFREHPRSNRFVQGLLLKEASAQQGEFLHRNAMLTYQGEVYTDRKFTSLAIVRDALERVPPDVVVLAEAGKHKFHQCRPSIR
jgi:hypothetical protein